MIVFEAAFDGGQGVGAGFRPAASRPAERNGMRPWSIRRKERCPLSLIEFSTGFCEGSKPSRKYPDAQAASKAGCGPMLLAGLWRDAASH